MIRPHQVADLTAEEREEAAMDWASERRQDRADEWDERYDLLGGDRHDEDDRDRALGLGRWAR